MLTVWSVSPRLAQLTEDPLDNRSKLVQVITYFFRFGNIIDIISILPFYAYWIQYGIKNHRMSSFMRILRIPRILRILNVSKRFSTVNVIIQIMGKTMIKSSKALGFTLFFVGLGVLVLAAVMYTLEQGTFMVTPSYPTGAYLREDYLGRCWCSIPARPIGLSYSNRLKPNLILSALLECLLPPSFLLHLPLLPQCALSIHPLRIHSPPSLPSTFPYLSTLPPPIPLTTLPPTLPPFYLSLSFHQAIPVETKARLWTSL